MVDSSSRGMQQTPKIGEALRGVAAITLLACAASIGVLVIHQAGEYAGIMGVYASLLVVGASVGPITHLSLIILRGRDRDD